MFVAAFLGSLLALAFAGAIVRTYAHWRMRRLFEPSTLQPTSAASSAQLDAFIQGKLKERPPAVHASECVHPEQWIYCLQIESDKLIGAAILWCRSCGSVNGWRPADDPSPSPWQSPKANAEEVSPP